MEVGIEPDMPTYSGGLGVLAGDTLKAAADLGVPMAGVTLLHRKGYFRQLLDREGNQTEEPFNWSPDRYLEPLPDRVEVLIEGRVVRVGVWRRRIRGLSGHTVPVYFLDTMLTENDVQDRTLTDYLYGGELRYRLSQEVILGFGGIAMLRALGYERVQAYHMNEGHSALLALALLEGIEKRPDTVAPAEADREAVREQCVFTTHTPVAAGHDKFPVDLVRRVLGDKRADLLEGAGCLLNGELNLTHTALVFSRYVNGVSMRHEEISRGMFPNYPINSITNGVHAATWTCEPFQGLYDRHMPEWRRDNFYLRYAISIPLEEIHKTHAEAKRGLVREVSSRTGRELDPDVMTIGFARRATAYKRADLLFADIERLKRIVDAAGPLQMVYAGKAHPRDEGGKTLIRAVHQAAEALAGVVRVVYLPDYDMSVARLMCSGVDLWLNTPLKPYEASGTSGMKAALNGVPSLSVLDGWWIEGHVEGVTGWSIGEATDGGSDPSTEAASMYKKLEETIVPMFYDEPARYARTMRNASALNGSFYNAQRMVFQYLENAYFARTPR